MDSSAKTDQDTYKVCGWNPPTTQVISTWSFSQNKESKYKKKGQKPYSSEGIEPPTLTLTTSGANH